MNNNSLQKSGIAPIREEAMDNSYTHVTIKEAEAFSPMNSGTKDNKVSFK